LFWAFDFNGLSMRAGVCDGFDERERVPKEMPNLREAGFMHREVHFSKRHWNAQVIPTDDQLGQNTQLQELFYFG